MSDENKVPQGITPNLPLWSFQLQKNSKLALKTRKDLEIHLITRALKDEDFKRQLIANPKVVIESELGTKLPDELEIKVLEETEDNIYMVLPCNPYEGLSEEELQDSLGMTYEDIAQWVLEQQRNTLLDEKSSIKLLSQAWRDNNFKQRLIHEPIKVIEEEVGEKIQQPVELIVLEEFISTIYIVMPFYSDRSNLNQDLSVFGNLELMVGCASIPITTNQCPITQINCPPLPSQRCSG
jgi:hypothetical protein